MCCIALIEIAIKGLSCFYDNGKHSVTDQLTEVPFADKFFLLFEIM